MRIIRTLLAGLGNVNLGFLRILEMKKSELDKLGINFSVVGVADSSGIAINEAGFGFSELIKLKKNGKRANQLEGFLTAKETDKLPGAIAADLLIESTPADLSDSCVGLAVARAALCTGCSVVFANKAPLVLAFDELSDLARVNDVKIAYSATVCGGLPVVNVLTRDLVTSSLSRLSGIFNATSNYVLEELSKGNSMEDAIAEAQRIGAAETDPEYDLSGKDTASKLFIIMKSFTSYNGTIADISIEGIRGVNQSMIKEAASLNQTIKLIASAEKQHDTWKLSVKPESVPMDQFLGSCNGWEMGLEVETDLYEKIYLKNYEADPLGTSAAVLRDALEVGLI